MDHEEVKKTVKKAFRGALGGHTISNPKKVIITESPRAVWSMGWWLSQETGESYLLVRHADVNSFTRDEADSYIDFDSIEENMDNVPIE